MIVLNINENFLSKRCKEMAIEIDDHVSSIDEITIYNKWCLGFAKDIEHAEKIEKYLYSTNTCDIINAQHFKIFQSDCFLTLQQIENIFAWNSNLDNWGMGSTMEKGNDYSLLYIYKWIS